MKKVLLGIALIVIIAMASVFIVSPEKAEQAALISICSDMSRDSMKSPDSYRMISASTRMSIGLSEVGARGIKEEYLRKSILSGETPYRLANVSVKQEAQNSFGVKLAGDSYCRYSILGKPLNANYRIISVNIDGKEIPEWNVIALSKGDNYSISKEWYRNRLRYLWYSVSGKS